MIFRGRNEDFSGDHFSVIYMLSHNRIRLLGVDVVRDPLLFEVVMRILTRSIPHRPQWRNATDLVRKGTPPAGSMPAHEDLDRKLNFPARPLHLSRITIMRALSQAARV